jgi:hypothetical protein
LKKVAKKILVLQALVRLLPKPAGPKVFWFFFFKKEPLACFARRNITYNNAVD